MGGQEIRGGNNIVATVNLSQNLNKGELLEAGKPMYYNFG